MVLILLIFALDRSLVVCNSSECEVTLVTPIIYLLIVIVISIVAQIYIYTEIKHNYIDRRLVLLNIIIDLLIFIGAIFEMVFYLILPNRKLFTADRKIFFSAVVIITFARIYHLMLLMCYPCLVYPCFFMPDCCPCKRMLEEDIIDD